MATNPRARKAPETKTPAVKPPAEKSEESSSFSSRWQDARAIGMNFGNYLQIEKHAASKTPKAAAPKTEAVTGSYRRGRIWA